MAAMNGLWNEVQAVEHSIVDVRMHAYLLRASAKMISSNPARPRTKHRRSVTAGEEIVQ